MKKNLTIPNGITVFRGIVAIIGILFLWEGNYVVAFWLLLPAISLDWLDGFLARKLHQETKLGIVLDPIVDKITIWIPYILLTSRDLLIPPLLVGIIILQDLLTLSGILWLRSKKLPIPNAMMIGKIGMWLRSITLLVTLLPFMVNDIFYVVVLQMGAMFCWFSTVIIIGVSIIYQIGWFPTYIIGKGVLGSYGYVFRNIVQFFFYKQFKEKLLKRGTLRRIDHPLDDAIPFQPERVHVYQTFTLFWIKLSINMWKTGKKAEVVKYVRAIGDLYLWADKVYSHEPSTMTRPTLYEVFKASTSFSTRLQFTLIHIFDSHLFCDPSLHVMVTLYSGVKFEEIMKAEDAQVQNKVREIIESILYIKQHSINCLPGAFYTLSCCAPATFTQVKIQNFISSLFKDPFFDAELGEKIRCEIEKQYKALINKNYSSRYFLEPWEFPIIEFLRNYNQAAK